MLSKFTPGDSPNKKQGVETFADMLAEVRKYGEALIIVDQIPNKLTPEVLKNTNTKIIHKLFAKDDKEAVGNTMALNDEQKNFLSYLEPGRVIVITQGLSKPMQVQVRPLDNLSTTDLELIPPDDLQKNVLLYYAESYRRGIIRGLEYLYQQTPDVDEVKQYLDFVRSSPILTEWVNICDNPSDEIGDGFKESILKSRYSKDLDFLAKMITGRLYQDDEGLPLSCIKTHLTTFLKGYFKGKKSKFNMDDTRILRIRRAI